MDQRVFVISSTQLLFTVIGDSYKPARLMGMTRPFTAISCAIRIFARQTMEQKRAAKRFRSRSELTAAVQLAVRSS